MPIQNETKSLECYQFNEERTDMNDAFWRHFVYDWCVKIVGA